MMIMWEEKVKSKTLKTFYSWFAQKIVILQTKAFLATWFLFLYISKYSLLHVNIYTNCLVCILSLNSQLFWLSTRYILRQVKIFSCSKWYDESIYIYIYIYALIIPFWAQEYFVLQDSHIVELPGPTIFCGTLRGPNVP